MRRFPLVAALAALTLAGCAPGPYERTAEALGLPGAAVSAGPAEVRVAGGGHVFAFAPGKRPARVDGTLYHLNRAAGREGLDAADAALLRQAVVAPPPAKPRLTVMVDAGHGGRDRGCAAGGAWESAITLDVAREVRRLLEARGHRVLMTRTEEGQTLALPERVARAAGAPIDAFVSIHVNSAANPEANGAEVYTLPAPGCDGTAADARAWPAPLAGQAHLAQATRLALAVQRALTALPGGPADRGVRHAHFLVLRDVPAPAILVEAGFLTNAGDAARLTSPAGRRALAAAIAEGVASLAGGAG